MITSTEAKKRIESHTPLAPLVRLSLLEAAGLILGEDIIAPYDIPSFPQSSMDGYAFAYEGWAQHKSLFIDGEVAAGDSGNRPLVPANAVRIFTGAPVPQGADTVIEQEKTRVDQGFLYLEKEDLRQGQNVRDRGSEIKAGDLALMAGSLLSPAAVGFLSATGIPDVMVYKKPRVGIIVTGDELQTPGQALAPGQVYEANSATLIAALAQCHIHQIDLYKAADNLDILTQILSDALEKSDLVLLTGGVSVGDYDFVLRAAECCGVAQVFHKIKQKPGKPLYFGMKSDKIVFGLPGNPGSVLTCFYQYVLVALSKYLNQDLTLRTLEAPLSAPYQKNAGLTHFLKGYYDGREVIQGGGQESFRLATFATSNCLIEIPENDQVCLAGHLVKVHLIQ